MSTATIAEIVDSLAAQGIGVTSSDGRLVVRSRTGEIAAAAMEVLRSRKSEFLAHFSSITEQTPGLVSVPVGVEVRASSVQQRFWWLSQGNGADAYVIVAAHIITGPLDRAVWSAAVTAAMRRHGAFSLSFVERDGTLFQRLESRDPPRLECRYDVALGQADVDALIDRFAATPFDIEGGVLATHGLFSDGDDDRHVYLLACHHIIADGQSLNIFFADVSVAYDALVNGRVAVFPKPAPQYIDLLAASQGRTDAEDSVRYWVDQLQGPKDALGWPASRVSTGEDGAHIAPMPMGLSSAVRDFARSHNLSQFSVFYAAFKLLLARVCGTRDFILGHAVANRADPASDGAVGCFANAIVLRAHLSPTDAFLHLVQRVNSETIASLQHQAAPLENVVEQLRAGQEGTSWHGLQAFLSMQESGAPRVRGLELKRLLRTPKRAKFPLGLAIDLDEAGGAMLAWEYSSSHVDAATAVSFHEWYVSLLADVLAQPARALSEFPIRRSTPLANTPLVTPSRDGAALPDIISLFRLMVARHAEKPALVFGSDRLSYRELDVRSDSAAEQLIAAGAVSGGYVGIAWSGGLERIVVLIAILKVGCAYVPMPPQASSRRQSELVSLLGMRLCAGPSGTRYGGLDCLDPLRAKTSRGTDAMFARRSHSSVAYVNFSSGTTGAPKAIACCDAGVARLVIDQDFARLDESLVMLSAAPIDFDAFTLELWGPLLNGGTCVLHAGGVLGPDELRGCIQRHGVNTLWLTSALFNTLVDLDCEALGGLRELLVGGDVVSPEHVTRVYARHSRLRIVNGYGPTENTTFTACYAIPRDWNPADAIPLGKPIRGTEVFVLDIDDQPAPVGVVGEIVATGDGLALGYAGRADLTAMAFPRLQIHGRTQRCYRTGDFGFFDSKGDLHFRGRKDGQIKLDGHRVELSGIDHALRSHPNVRDAATVLDRRGAIVRLVSFVVFEGDDSPAVRAAIGAALEQELPPHQRPKELRAIDALPLSSSGKVDRASLMAACVQRAPAVAVSAHCAVREEISRLWAELLQCTVNSPEVNFFHAGGSSLLAIRMIARANARFGSRLRFAALSNAPTLEAFSAEVKRATDHTGAATPGSFGTRAAASQRQRLLWSLQQLEPRSARYNVHVALDISGPLDTQRLIAGVKSTYCAYASLRSSFESIGGELFCVASRNEEWLPEYVETSASELAPLLSGEAERAFDLQNGPLFVARVIRLDECHHVLQLNAHHAIVDGWSIQTVWQRIRQEYSGDVDGVQSYELPSGDPPADEVAKATSRLAGHLAEIQVLPLFASTSVADSTEFVYRSLLSTEDVAGLERVANATGVSRFTVAVAAFALVIGRATRCDRFAISTPFANRERTGDREVGYFATMLPVGFDLGASATFGDMVAATQDSVRIAMANAEHDLESLLRLLGMDEGRWDNPLQRAVFTWQEELAEFGALDGAVVARMPTGPVAPKFPVLLTMAPGGDGAALSWEFDPRAVSIAEVQVLDNGFRTLLALLTPGMSLETFPMQPVISTPDGCFAAPTGKVAAGTVNATREAIRQVWTDLLGVPVDDADANFFSLGGSSLLCLRVQAELRKRYRLHAEIGTLLRHPTVERLALRIVGCGQKPEEMPTLSGKDLTAFPLSREQQRIWIAHSLAPSPAYNVPLVFEVAGDADLDRLQGAIREFAARHPALRSRVVLADAGPVQVVVDCNDWSVHVLDVDGDPAVSEAIRLETAHVFDLEGGLSSRAVFLRTGSGKVFLVLNVHHAFFDGHSLGVLMEELPALYRGSPMAAPVHSMSTVVAWQSSREYRLARAAALEYWRERLSGASMDTALPFDLNDAELRGHAGTHRLALGNRAAQQASEAARRLGATEFSFWLAILATVLARLGQKNDLIIATPAANRLRHEFEAIVGLLANTLPVRVRVDGEDSFDRLVSTVFEQVVEDIAHQSCPLEELGGRPSDVDTPPWTQVLFSVSSELDATGDGWRLERRPVQSAWTKYPLAITVITSEAGVEWLVEFDRGRYSAFAVAQFGKMVARVIGQVSEFPQRALREIHLAEQPPPPPVAAAFVPVTELIRRRSLELCPRDTAIHGAGTALTYAEMWVKVQRYAAVLHEAGAGPGRRVGVIMQRCDDLPIVLLAILATGAVYVPIDPAYPRERVEWILSDAQPELLVVDGNALAASLVTTATRLPFDALESGPVSAAGCHADTTIQAGDVAYIIYTSGSTGRPKGVAICHEGVCRLQQWAAGTYSQDDLENVLAGTSICFDLSVFEIFVVWSLGGGITFANSPLDLIEDQRSENVTLINTVPSLMRELLRSAKLPERLRVINLAGEALTPELVGEIAQSVTPDVRVFNLYGPSEDTTYSTFSRVDLSRPALVNIGHPLPGTVAHVLDADRRPMPDGFPGELYLSGRGLAAGYFGAPALTSERFLQADADSPRMYRTGDKVRRRQSGCLDYLGRLDDQCKLRGFRIELQEVDAALRRMDGIEEACAVVRRDAAGGEMLAGLITIRAGAAFDEHSIKQGLRLSLPDYMVPGRLFLLDRMPLTPSGKIDRLALSAETYRPAEAHRGPPSQASEDFALRQLVESVVGFPIADAHTPLLDYGVHSLQVIRLARALSTKSGRIVTPGDIYAHPTLFDLGRMFGKEDAPARPALWSIVDQVHRLCEKHRIPNAQFAAARGADVLLLNHGNKDVPHATPAAARGYRLSCNLKLLTLLLTLRMVEDEVFALEDLVTDLLPELQGTAAWEGVCVEHLLSHCHGLDFAMDAEAFDPSLTIGELAVRCARDAKRMFAPGSMYGYSMVGHTVIAHLCEKRSGTGFRELLTRYVVGPLGVTLRVGDEADEDNCVLGGHVATADGPVALSVPCHVPALLPSGTLGAYLSTGDLLVVGRSLILASLGGTGLLRDETVMRVYARRMPIENHPILAAAGLSLIEFENGYWGHLGDGDGQHSSVQIDPERGLVLACAASIYPAAALFGEVAGILFPLPDIAGKALNPVASPQSVPSIVGRYANRAAQVLTAATDGSYRLELHGRGDSTGSPAIFALEEIDPDRSIYRLPQPSRTVKGSVTYFGNAQGDFMRIGQNLFKKSQDR
ncbi:MAG: amino acid adenylation domain-containing protein [Pseudomonadota bacterium]|nr:amino acid adenylation domain-containing protein [Pseudomonadota bacterium]